MKEPTLDELLAPLDKAGRDPDDRLDVVADVAASLATHFDRVVEPALDSLAAHLAWAHRAALGGALGMVARTPRREAVLARLLVDKHVDVVAQTCAHLGQGLPPAAYEALRRLASVDAAHDQHIHALARARDPADEAHFRRAAGSFLAPLARAGIEGLGELARLDADSIAALAEACARVPTKTSAAGVLAHVAARQGSAEVARLLASRPPAKEALVRVIDTLDPRHQPVLRAITGAPPSSATRAAVGAPAASDLASFGTVLDGRRPEHAVRIGDDALVDQVAALLTGESRRSVVLVGPSGVGKTSAVHALARRLLARAPSWSVLETSTGEVLAGTRYLGEWETRLKRLIDLARAPARVVLYVTDVHALATQGKSADRDGTFADILAPYLDRGEIAIVAESTDDGLRRGMDRHGALRRVFERVRIGEPTPDATRAVVRGRISHASAAEPAPLVVPPAVLDQIVEASPLYAAGAVQPGAAARLTDQVLVGVRERLEKDASADRVVDGSDVIAALARSTGMPRELLDDRAPFDAAQVRAFFEERILGQREAVDVVVELVTLVKAGLTDPDRPYGSLFFVGPTGVGKTELAKALAEHLFGAPDRMVRIDMSELRDWDSHERLIGSVRNPSIEGQLVRRIAESPFSVVLLDEIEKAHPNVHDILLQLLDDGRLTDARGRTTDFRRTVVVMTSNVGARIDVDALGFGRAGGEAASEEAVLREVRRVFRPELVNRFGRIVVFRPLSADIVRTLARRELGKVVLRSGVLRRRLSVDLAPEVVDLLAREGFSAAYGARPLKRRVERRVLLPLAERIVSLPSEPAGTILRVEVTGEDVVVRAIAPPPPPASGRSVAPSRDRSGLASRLEGLLSRAAALTEHPRRLEAARRRAELVLALGQPTFWDDPARARASMTELADLDDREGSRETIERRLEGAADLVREAVRGPAVAAKAHAALDDIERALTMLEHRTFVAAPEDRADVVLALTRVGATSEAAQLLDALASMYEAWAEGHGVEVQRIDDTRDEAGASSIALHLVGHDLFASLREESGLHRLADVGRGPDRRTAAVRVIALPCPDAPAALRVERSPVRRGRVRLRVFDAAGAPVMDLDLPAKQARATALDAALAAWAAARRARPTEARDTLVRRYGVEDRYAVDESTGQRFRTKELPSTGLDAVFEARIRARLDAARRG